MAYLLAEKETRTKKIEAELKRILEKLKDTDVEKVILFGSAANGKINSKSDIDLIIVKKTDKPFFPRLEEIYAAIEPNMATDILVYTPEEFNNLVNTNPFILTAVKEGRLIYEARFQT